MVLVWWRRGIGTSNRSVQASEALNADLVWDLHTKEKRKGGRGGEQLCMFMVCVSPSEEAEKECTLEADVCMWTCGKICIPAPASTEAGRTQLSSDILLHGNESTEHGW